MLKDVSTRPSATRRQEMPLQKRLLAAFSFAVMATLPGLATATGTSTPQDAPEEVSSIAATGTPEVSIRVVEPGQESLSLVARLTDTSPTIATDVAWQVRNAMGELVLGDTTAELSRPLPPGEYSVEAAYGSVRLRQNLTLLAGNSLAVSFVLNAGGLRVLPALKGMETPHLASQTLIYAISGPQKGHLLAHGSTPGEIFKLSAGQYRVESRFGGGNAVAVTDVRVRPGRLSAIEVKHVGGLARLSFVGSPTARVEWDIKEEGGLLVSQFEGLEHELALKPGAYEAQARVGGETLSASFRIGAGEERNILLGN